MASWQTFEIQIPGKDILEGARSAMETLMVYLDVLKAILDTIKIFLVDFGNPIKALVEALIRLIEELFLSLKQSGIFAYFDVPDPTSDPNFDHYSGGYPALQQRFKASLFDAQDFNRPQPRQGSTQSGFVLMVVSADTPYALIARIKQLLRFFGREFVSPRYEAPDNLRAIPVGASGDPILAVASVFTDGPIEAIQLQWSLPTSLSTPDPGFTDVVTKVAKEFIPPKFLIERTTVNPAAQKIDITDLGTAGSSGLTEYTLSTYANVADPSKPIYTREVLRDEYGDPVVKFQKYTILGQLDIESILGQLGKFRYVDTDVEVGKTYYYRVRALSGDLKMNGDQVVFPQSYNQLDFTIESSRPQMKWPSNDSDSVIMGKASGIVSATVPATLDPATFDIIENLVRLFETAFSLDFHLEPNRGASSGPTPPEQEGRGSLTDLASALAVFESLVIVGDLSRAKTINEAFQPDPILGSYPEVPWQKTTVIRQSKRLANTVASALLQAGGESMTGFRNIMQGPLPAGTIATGGTLTGATNLEQVVFNFTEVRADGTVSLAGAQTYVQGYYDKSLRTNVLTAVRYIKTYTLGGAPVDWISVVPLRDIVPWSGQIIYDLLAKIQALLDGFSGVMTEINAFIALLERKIEALERSLESLINILNLVESLQIGAYILSVPELNGSAESWVNAIDTAGGTPPPAGPGGYSAGVAFGYVGTDISAFKTAFSIIFG